MNEIQGPPALPSFRKRRRMSRYGLFLSLAVLANGIRVGIVYTLWAGVPMTVAGLVLLFLNYRSRPTFRLPEDDS